MTSRVITGDCREVLATLDAGSVQCCVTSPPYFGLRDYGTATWEGGDAGCDHARGLVPVSADDPGIRCSTLDGGKRTTTAQAEARSYRDTCGKCGARRIDAQIGLEQSPDAYVAEMVAVFREVRRVLADSGCVFLNLGDAYADKQLRMIPARVALALQADAWVLRSDIIWAKPNPMPESVTSRPTSAHEHVFLLSKRASYFYDAEAVAEQQTGHATGPNGDKSGKPAVKGVPDRRDGGGTVGAPLDGTRNLRNVWSIATQPYSGAHFAVMPADLAERCIKAGTSERGQCPHCAAPWARVVEREGSDMAARYARGEPSRHGAAGAAASGASNVGGYSGASVTTGWSPTCTCPEHAPVPQTVLDPFAGAGTTLLVADRLGRNGIGVELNPAYAVMARNRLTDDCPLFADVAD